MYTTEGERELRITSIESYHHLSVPSFRVLRLPTNPGMGGV